MPKPPRPEGLTFDLGSPDADWMRQVFEAIPEKLPSKDLTEAAPAPPPKPKPLKRKGLMPDETLDLHGKTREEAIFMVQNFILIAHRQQLSTLLIITGQGKHSGGRPVLKQAVETWLQRNGSRYVKHFGTAPPEHGGAGAVWIELK